MIATSTSHINHLLEDVANNLKTMHMTHVQEAETKKPGRGKFDESKKHMFLIFASQDSRIWDTEPADILKELMCLSTDVKAHAYLTQHLFAKI